MENAIIKLFSGNSLKINFEGSGIKSSRLIINNELFNRRHLDLSKIKDEFIP
uniref:Uncharacterized protein n=1 Tax=Rhizophagus irregularis (strain DAOM 181602 / DAOM 197198 / MUCL 43194) TaxID=747089 RepID=U9SYA2_RHIID